MIKAAKYLGFSELWPEVNRLIHAGWRLNVRKGLEDQRDLPVMKGYYQWSSMAWHELLTSDRAKNFKDYKKRLVDYGLWMVKVHDVLGRTKNTGYAFEGLVPAYLAAEKLDRKKDREALGCAIDEGMRRVSAMQLGHPL